MEPSRETTVLFALLIGGDELYAKAGDKKAHEAIEHCHTSGSGAQRPRAAGGSPRARRTS
jgi:hypothetical protein